MATNTPATESPMIRLRFCWALSANLGGGLEDVGDIAAEPHDGDDEDQDHEQDQPQGQGDIAAAARARRLLALVERRQGHLSSSSGRTPARRSISSVANRSAR